MGSLILTRNVAPVWLMSDLPVAVGDLDAAQTAALLGLEVGSLVSVTGFPAAGGAPTSAALWVEGWTETLAWGSTTSPSPSPGTAAPSPRPGGTTSHRPGPGTPPRAPGTPPHASDPSRTWAAGTTRRRRPDGTRSPRPSPGTPTPPDREEDRPCHQVATAHGYPYPLGTDRVMDGDDAIKALADKIEARLTGGLCTGNVTMNNIAAHAKQYQVFVYPVGMFTAPPQVFTGIEGVDPSFFWATASSADVNSCTVACYNNQAVAASVAVYVLAHLQN